MNAQLQRGFSLVELSLVLVVIGVLAGSAVIPLTSVIRQSHYRQTDAQLAIIREAMHGYLVSHGKLPCPLDNDLINPAKTDATASCQRSLGGVPAAALGIMGERSATGAVLDSWGNPIQYAVSLSDNKTMGQVGVPDWLTTGEPANVGVEHLDAGLSLCRVAAANRCSRVDLIADQIVWVVYSTGESQSATGIQVENQDSDSVFAVTAYSSNVDSPFDDQLVWASRSELVYWLLRANWLP